MNIALLGGSFNPPHLIHQMACLYLLQAEEFDQVIVFDAPNQAEGSRLAGLIEGLRPSPDRSFQADNVWLLAGNYQGYYTNGVWSSPDGH